MPPACADEPPVPLLLAPALPAFMATEPPHPELTTNSNALTLAAVRKPENLPRMLEP